MVGDMKKKIDVNVIRHLPTISWERVRAIRTHEEILNLTRRPFIVRNMEYSLPPYFFARTNTKARVFTGPYKTLLEKLEVIGESKKMFQDIPVSFDSDGVPRLNAEHHPKQADTASAPELLLPLAE
jgi:hypothetical protein